MLLYQRHISHSWIIALHCLFCICAAPLWHNFREQCVWDDREISFDGWTCVWKSSWWTADPHEYGKFSYVITWLLLLGRIFLCCFSVEEFISVHFRDSFIRRDNNTDEAREEDVRAMTSPPIAECEVALFFTVTYSFSLKSKLRKRVGVCIRACGRKRVRERREGESKCYSWLLGEVLAYGKKCCWQVVNSLLLFLKHTLQPLHTHTQSKTHIWMLG